jgi:hypothetical protein
MKGMSMFAAAMLLVMSSACAVRQGDFTILSTKNVEISRVDLKRIDFQRNLEGSDGRFWFLFIPFGSAPTLEDACDRCLEAGNGDFMTSAVIYSTGWTVILCSWESWSVKGDVGDSLSKGAADLPDRKLEN